MKKIKPVEEWEKSTFYDDGSGVVFIKDTSKTKKNEGGEQYE